MGLRDFSCLLLKKTCLHFKFCVGGLAKPPTQNSKLPTQNLKRVEHLGEMR
jgi:hypothetical protein